MEKKFLGNILIVAIVAMSIYLFLEKKITIIKQPTSTSIYNETIKPSSYENKLIECKSIPNNSIKEVRDTSRLFINLPKDVYPYENITSNFLTVSGNATAGYVSNAGYPGQAFEATEDCWSTYMEFDGNGQVDLKLKSALKDMPDYFIRFVVNPAI